MDRELILVKLGGSVITDKAKPFCERREIITRLANEIHSSRVEEKHLLIVGHGGGSYPHVPAKKYHTYQGYTDQNSPMGAALVQDAASRLNRIVVDALLDVGEPAISVQPSSAVISKNSKIALWDLDALKQMLQTDLLPVPYGDVGMDRTTGFCILSTEEIFRYLSVELKPKRVLIGTDVDGVYDSDPKINAKAKKITIITPDNAPKVLPSLEGATTVDVTGGMRSKVLTLIELVKQVDVECEVLNLLTPGNLKDALNGERCRGTIIRKE